LAEQHERQQQLHQMGHRQQQQHTTNSDAGSSSMAGIDASTVNPEVWAAAQLVGDKGVQLISIYRDLEGGRCTCLGVCCFVSVITRPETWVPYLCSGTGFIRSVTSCWQETHAVSRPDGTSPTCWPLMCVWRVTGRMLPVR
jgi:hypothetical protein